jgi:cephalosporin-C deacetylase-like acetyl esterase
MKSLTELLAAPPRGAMVPNFIVRRAADLAERPSGSESLAPGTPSRSAIRRGLRDALGLDRIEQDRRVRWVERVAGDGFDVEKLVFQAARGLDVPALLYMPRGPGLHPAVVHPPGHWMEDAKLAPDLQIFNEHLARNGIAVLCYDTLGQGERRIGWHQHGQLAPLLVGFTSLGLMVNDSLAAIDLLASHREIDDSRIGIVGASGGGFSSIFASVLDERISVAAIACMVNTHVSQIRDAAFGTGWDSWVDLCNQVPGLCTVGTVGEILSCVSPRQLLVANATEDPGFPIAGAREVADEIRTILGDSDMGDTFEYAEVPGGHGLLPDMRAAVSRYLVRKLVGGVPAAPEDVPVLFAPQWEVTHNRASAERPQSKAPAESAGTCLSRPLDSNGPVLDLAKRRAARMRAQRTTVTPDRVKRLLGAFPARSDLVAHVSNHVSLPDFHAQRLELPTEDGITLDALFTLPVNWSDDLAPVLIVLDEGGKGEASTLPEVRSAQQDGWAVLMPDLRGTGESATSEFEMATAAWMLDRDLLNQRVWDTLRCVDFLSSRYSSAQQIDKGRIAIWGTGAFGLIALLAAAIDTRLRMAVARDLRSLEDAMSIGTPSPMLFRFNILEVLDLSDLVDCIAPRRATLAVDHDDVGALLKRLKSGEPS